MKALPIKHEFTTELVLERSASPRVESTGVHHNEMEVFVDDPYDEVATIEWTFWRKEDQSDLDSVAIGCWFDGKRLRDYDGVFELNSDAIKALRKNGFTVPRDFES